MKKPHGFVISWFYPPNNSSEGLVTYKLLKNSSFTYDVATHEYQKSNDIWNRNIQETNLVADNVNTIPIPANNEKEWITKVIEYFKKNADKYDFIMSRIMPPECHAAALEIKKLFPKILWVASFGDPLVNTPYIKTINKQENYYFLSKYLFREKLSIPKTAKLILSPTRYARKIVWEKDRLDKMIFPTKCAVLNKLTFENADCLIFNNPYQFKRAFIEPYSQYKNKGIIINHSFDLDLYPEKVPQRPAKHPIHFVYTGHLDSFRNASSLLQAIGKLKKLDSHLAEKVQFDFYGHIDDSDKVIIVDNKIHDVVNIHPDISYLTSLQKIKEADWLILIDTNLNDQLEKYIYLPAKLMDYFGAKGKVLAITQLHGATADAMRAVGAGQIVTHSADEIALYLSKIIYQNYNPVKYNQSAWEQYNAKNVSTAFDNIIKQYLGSHSRKGGGQ